MQDVFVEALGVPELTVELVYDELVAATGEDGVMLSVEGAKEALRVFNSLLVANGGGYGFDPEDVLVNPVFPVRFPNGKVVFRTATEDFALRDRKFMEEAKFLDFEMEEVRLLQPLFHWAGIENRYLSREVTEITGTDTESARPISIPHREVKRHAHVLLRYVGPVICFNYAHANTNSLGLP